jgi:N-acetyl-gamma-glutamylphosphate reductase
MVKFEFTLDDTDATNLIDILHEEKARCFDIAADARVNKDYADWCVLHAEYLENLKKKIINGSSRVE